MKPTIEAFWEKVERTDSGCWLWTASKRNKGYGAFAYTVGGRLIQERAHRYSYEIHTGQIPYGLFVLHKCDTPACVNPDHLFLGTNQDNVTDMMKKGRHVKGGTYGAGCYAREERHHNAKLNSDIVREIRQKYDAGGTSFSQLSQQYGIGVPHAHKIVNRKLWKNVT